jgi:hypothetical protein
MLGPQCLGTGTVTIATGQVVDPVTELADLEQRISRR